MNPAELTESTIRYLFATSWLPSGTGETEVAVPGGSTRAIDTAGNLLHIAMWSLRRQRVMEFEQLRAVEKEPVRFLAGQSFARFTLLDRTAMRRGLEGALLEAARDVEAPRGRLAKAIDRVTGEDEHGLRLLIRALDLHSRSPWGTVCGYCFSEAAAAGLVKAKGRLTRKILITDPPAVESLRERHDELRAARGAYLEAEPKLTGAVMSDCLQTVADSYSSGSD